MNSKTLSIRLKASYFTLYITFTILASAFEPTQAYKAPLRFAQSRDFPEKS